LAIFLVISLIFSSVQVSFAATGDVAGTFVLTAVKGSGFVIEPVEVSYTQGQTVKDALKASGHQFDGIDQGFITSIDGQVDNYSMFYDGNKYDLDAQASEIKNAIVFTTRDDAYSENYIALAALLGVHSQREDAVKNYTQVKTAYEAAMKGLPSATEETAKTLYDNLMSAYAKCEEWLSSNTAEVNFFTYYKGEEYNYVPIDSLVFTDEYGNEYNVEKLDSSYPLRKANYDFKATKGNCEVTGSFAITEEDVNNNEKEVRACVPPEEEWIADIQLREKSGTTDVPFKSEEVDGILTFYVPDTVISPYIYLDYAASIADEAADYKVYSEHTSHTLNKYYGDESVKANRMSWQSTAHSLTQILYKGLEGKTSRLKVVYKDADGNTQRQYKTIEFVRVPTLTGLTVKDGDTDLGLSFNKDTKEYNIETVADTLTVKGSTGAYDAGYSIDVDGETQAEGGSVDVAVSDGQKISVKAVADNGQENEYIINVKKVAAQTVTVTKEAGVDVVLLNSAGSEIKPESTKDTQAVFKVAPGNYTWVSTIDQYYHAKGSVAVSEGSSAAVSAATPEKKQLLTGLKAASNTAANAKFYESDKEFSWENHEYTYSVSDQVTTFALWASKKEQAITVTRESYVNTKGTAAAAKEFSKYTLEDAKLSLSSFIQKGGNNNNVVVTASETKGGVTYYQEYHIKTIRKATLQSLSVTDSENNSVLLTQDNESKAEKFDFDNSDYIVNIPKKTEALNFSFIFCGGSASAETVGEYTVKIGGETFKNNDGLDTHTASVALDETKNEEIIEIEAESANPENIKQVYRVKVVKASDINIKFDLTPQDGNVYLLDNRKKERVFPNDEGVYELMQGSSYTYTATAYGYVGEKKEFTAEKDETIVIDLKKAEENETIDKTITAQWPYFRADENNNGVVDSPVPVKAEDTVLYWANKIGEGWGGGATGCPIMVDGYIYTYAGKAIHKVDAMTGEVVQTGEMVASSSFAINSPAYAEGMIFVGLSNGRVQAFNADTMESLWVYQDELKGQPNCPIAYKNGYIYTGFWNAETRDANFVCLSITDEDPTKPDEEKLAAWTHKDAGFYWAGAYASENFILVGTDDGESGYTSGSGSLLSLDPKTGKITDRIENGFKGDIRSSVAYDPETERYYFTTKGGYFCSVKVNEDGTFVEGSVTRLYLDNYATVANCPPMSTSTPVIHNGRAYIGVSGTSQFGAYSGHNITVIDLTGDAPEIAYKVRTKGYPQTSGLLTTAYDEGDGTVYVYFFDNYTPGQLRVLKDKPGQTEAELITKETSGKNTYDTAYTLFTPSGTQAQYAICSPLADEWGNIYFKNDSAQMMMLGAKITKLEVTKQPDRLKYAAGESFDPAGMVVTATYANGKTRDVTKYISYPTEALEESDTEIEILFDIGENMQMYQDKDGVAGSKYNVPAATVDITVKTPCTEHTWDAGEVTKEPTCKEDGVKTYACAVCGETKTEIIAKTEAHTWDAGKVTKEPTCKEDGVKTYTCAVCGETKTEVIAKTEAHTWDAGAVTKEPTCKEDGVKTYTCTVCGGTKTEAIAKTESHTWDAGEVTKEPTCKEDGVKTYTCTVCGETKTEAIAKTEAHTWDAGAVIKEPTCKEDGIKTYICEICGAVKSEVLSKTNIHTWDAGEVTKEPTCKEDGVKTYTCTVCGETKTEAIAKIEAHTWDAGKVTKEPTCKEDGVKTYTCTVCGETKTEAIAKLDVKVPEQQKPDEELQKKDTATNETPKTGDEEMLSLWMWMLVATGALMLAQKKKKIK